MLPAAVGRNLDRTRWLVVRSAGLGGVRGAPPPWSGTHRARTCCGRVVYWSTFTGDTEDLFVRVRGRSVEEYADRLADALGRLLFT